MSQLELQPEETLWKGWKEKSRVDYTPIFVALWLSFNAWVKKEYKSKNKPSATDRDYINSLKADETSGISSIFAELINPKNKDVLALKFRGDLAGLIRSLTNANICYQKDPENIISFENCITTGASKDPKYVSVMKKQRQWRKIQISDDLWVENNVQRVFTVYIEILYRIRCAFFHGTLAPTEKNERVIRHLYLTLSVLMERTQ